MPRVEPLGEDQWDEDLRRILEASPPGLTQRLGDNNIFPTLARHKDLFRAWLPFGGYLLGAGTLPARERELLIRRSKIESLLFRAADELHEDSKVSDPTWAKLADAYDERGLIEITILVGHYHLVAFALNSLEVELDEGLEGLPS